MEAKEFAVQAAAARREAEVAAAQANAAEDAARRQAESLFPTLEVAEQTRREEEEAELRARREEAERLRAARAACRGSAPNATKLLEQLNASSSGSLFGPGGSTTLGKKAQKQVVPLNQSGGGSGGGGSGGSGGGQGTARKTGGWADLEDSDDLPPIPFDAEIPEWRRRPEEEKQPEAKPFVPAPVPSKSAWGKPKELSPTLASAASAAPAASAGPLAASAAAASAAPVVSSAASYRALHKQMNAHPASQRQRDDWGAQRAPPAPPSLAVVQAQQAGEEEARLKLESLLDMGFSVDTAAAALLRCGGDVAAAAAALGVRHSGGARGSATETTGSQVSRRAR